MAVYEKLFALYRKAYFALGTRSSAPVAMGDILPELRIIARKAAGHA